MSLNVNIYVDNVFMSNNSLRQTDSQTKYGQFPPSAGKTELMQIVFFEKLNV